MAGLKRVGDRLNFRRRCERAERKTGLELTFYDDATSDRVFEDDGALFICRHGIRACFRVGSDVPEVHNQNVREVMAAMRLKVTDDLLEEEEEDDEYCPHCGQ